MGGGVIDRHVFYRPRRFGSGMPSIKKLPVPDHVARCLTDVFQGYICRLAIEQSYKFTSRNRLPNP